MRKPVFIVFFLLLICKMLPAQTESDADYLKKIDSLETKIEQIKSLPEEQKKQYFTTLSDVENRKNTLKTLLKTPAENRDKVWEEKWTKNYIKASEKLKNIKLK